MCYYNGSMTIAMIKSISNNEMIIHHVPAMKRMDTGALSPSPFEKLGHCQYNSAVWSFSR